MSRIYLGELEELVLLIVALLNNEAYGVSISEELRAQAGRELALARSMLYFIVWRKRDLFNQKWEVHRRNEVDDANDFLRSPPTAEKPLKNYVKSETRSGD